MSEKDALPVVQYADGLLFGLWMTVAGAPAMLVELTPLTAFAALVASSFCIAQTWEGMIERTAEAYR